jgi:endonuclease I
MQLKQLVRIALSFKQGAAAQDKAATQLRKACRSRDKAKEAMLPAMAKAYGARTTTTKSGAVRWAKGCKAAAAAKRALNRLLSLAYQGKSNTKRSKVDAVTLLVRKFGKLSAAQQRRFLNSVK